MWTAALLGGEAEQRAQRGVLSQGCPRGTALLVMLSQALLGDAPHSRGESTVMQTVLPAAVQQQVQLLEEQGGAQQDAPKQDICQGRLWRQAGLGCPLLPSNCSSSVVLYAESAVCEPGKGLAPARRRDGSSKQQFSFVFQVKTTKAQQPPAAKRKWSDRGSRKL